MSNSPVIVAGLKAVLSVHAWKVRPYAPWPADTRDERYVIVALPLPGNGVETTLSPTRVAFPRARIVVWQEVHPEALAAAAQYDAWLTTSASGEALVEALEEQPLKVGIAEGAIASDAPSALDWHEWLNSREYELACLLAPGIGRHELAYRMQVSEDGVRYHIRHLLRKTGARSLFELRLLRPEQIVELAEAYAVAERALATERD